MSLNIKNEETCRLARELAQLTGEGMKGAHKGLRYGVPDIYGMASSLHSTLFTH